MGKTQAYIYVAAVVAVLLAGVVIWNNRKTDQSGVSPSLDYVVTTSPTVDIIPSDWTTYEDERYEYTIKLPQGTNVEVTGELEDCTKFTAPGGAFVYIGSYQTGSLWYDGYCGPVKKGSKLISGIEEGISSEPIIYENKTGAGLIRWQVWRAEYGSSLMYGVEFDRVVLDEEIRKETAIANLVQKSLQGKDRF